MTATITTVVEPDRPSETVFLVTRRELAVLTVALTVLTAAVLLLIMTSGQMLSMLFGSG